MFIHRIHRGGERICSNGPDEGMSKTAKLDCESEDKQIRFWEPEGRDSRRFKRGLKARVGEQTKSLRTRFNNLTHLHPPIQKTDVHQKIMEILLLPTPPSS